MRPYERIQAGRALAHEGDSAAPRPLTGRVVLLSLLAFFAVVISVNGVLMAFAIGTMPGLESAKPYHAGINYNAEIETARAQAARRWQVVSHVERDGAGRAAVRVETRDADGAPLGGLTVKVKLMRPADQRADRSLSLSEREMGIYLGNAADVAPGVWDLDLEARRGPERLFRSHNRLTLR